MKSSLKIEHDKGLEKGKVKLLFQGALFKVGSLPSYFNDSTH